MNQIRTGVILNFVIIGLTTLTGLLYTPYMLRCLGQNEYGLYSLVASIIAYLTILDAGFSNAAIRFTGKLRAQGHTERLPGLYAIVLLTNLLMSVIVIAAGILLWANVDTMFDRTMSADDIRQARTMIVLLVANLALTFPLGLFTAIIKANERFIFIKTLNILRIILVTLTIVVLLSRGYRAVAMVAVQTGFNVAILLFNLLYALRRLHVRLCFRRLSRDLFRQVFLYSIWMQANAVIERLYWATGPFILGLISGTVAVAIFSAAMLLQQMYQTMSGAISDVLLPRISALTANSADPAARRLVSDLFLRVGRIQGALLMLIISGFIIFGRPFFTLWAGAGYEESYYVALIIFLGLFPSAVQNVGILILQGHDRMRFCVSVEAITAVGAAIGQYYLSRIWGPTGCAAAIAIALIIGPGLILNAYYRRRLDIATPLFWRQLLHMSLIPAALTGGALLLLHAYPRLLSTLASPLPLLAAIILYLLLYLPAVWHLSLLPPDRTLLRSTLR